MIVKQSSAAVLRDVVVRGELALPRRRGEEDSPFTRASGPAVMAAVEMPRPAANPEEDIARRAWEEGFAQGRSEGRARGHEEAQQQAAEAAHQATRELEGRAERMALEFRQQANAHYEARLQLVEGLIEALPPQVEARLAAAEDDMLALCFAVVCRVLGESAARPGTIRAQLAHAFEQLRRRKLVAVHLHPDDLATLEKDDGVAGLDVEWVASTEIALGGCILQSPEGGLDARFETQLDALRDLLRQGRASSVAAVPEDA